MARPKIEINWDEFDKLCFMQATQQEIAWWFGCSVDTIDRACKRERKRSFADYFQEKGGRGRISLRRKQFEMAMGGNVALLVWLGKQYLGQTEKIQEKIETKHDGPLDVVLNWADEDADQSQAQKSDAAPAPAQPKPGAV